jgi:hypothetical protein
MLQTLLSRGDCVAVEHGRLVIRPSSGNAVPSEWLNQHRHQLVAEIAQLIGMDAFAYRSYKTGLYGRHLAGGLNLTYRNVRDDAKCSVIFNVELTRERTTKHGQAGEPLPTLHFRVTENHAFVGFWKALGLPLPLRGLTTFHDCMGKLSGMFITGRANASGKLSNSSITPLCISAADIKAANSKQSNLPDNRPIISRQSPDNYPITSRQSPDNYPISIPDKNVPQTQVTQDLERYSGTCANSHVLSKQVSTFKEQRVIDNDSLSPTNSPEDQTTEEWLSDYNNHVPCTESAYASAKGG